jgi:hypothetical protein
MYEQSEQVNELYKALAAAQAVLGRADKDGKNPHYRSRYATLTSVIEAVRPVFAEHGLSIMQHPHHNDGMVQLTTIIGHASGQWARSVCSVPIGKRNDSHALGSAISYLRRYALASVACLVQDDDDGNQVSHVQRKSAPKPAPAPAPPMSAQAFKDAVADVEITIEELLGWCEAHGKGDPREYPLSKQRMLFSWLEKKSKVVQQWAIDNALGGGEG